MSNSASEFPALPPLWFYTPLAGGRIRLIGRREVEVMAVSESMRDPDFRNLLVDDPKTAIEQMIGTTLPAALTIEIITEKEGEVVFVLPSNAGHEGWTELETTADEMMPYMAAMRAEERTLRLDDEVYAALVARAWRDERFRGELMARPKSAIESMYSGCFYPDTEVRAVAETGDRIFLLLPPAEIEEESLVPGLGAVNVNPMFVEVLQSNLNAWPTFVPGCKTTQVIIGCPQAACTPCLLTLGR